MSHTPRGRILKAIKTSVLLCATAHIVLLIIHSILRGDMTTLNVFNILDLDLFIPGIQYGNTSFIGSYVFFTLVVTAAYILQNKKQ